MTFKLCDHFDVVITFITLSNTISAKKLLTILIICLIAETLSTRIVISRVIQLGTSFYSSPWPYNINVYHILYGQDNLHIYSFTY